MKSLQYVLLGSLLCNVIVICIAINYAKKYDTAAKAEEYLIQLGTANQEYEDYNYTLHNNYHEGTVSFYESDEFMKAAVAKQKLDQIKTVICNKYGFALLLTSRGVYKIYADETLTKQDYLSPVHINKLKLHTCL